MYPIPPTETLVQTKTCRHCSALFPITDKDLEFYEKVSSVFPRNSPSIPLHEGEVLENPPYGGGKNEAKGGVKIEWDRIRCLIPTPTLCPDCRQQRRLSFRNERKLYKRKCDATGKDIVSIYSPDKSFTVYHQDYWWSDKWDPMDYGRDFDFNRGFFEQFGELMREVPCANITAGTSNENSDYINYGTRLKDCYLVFTCEDTVSSFYGNYLIQSSHCIDSINALKSEIIYQCIDVENCYHVFFSESCNNCRNSFYLKNCSGCEFCFGCENLTNQTYHVFNKSVSKEVFEQTIQEACTNGWKFPNKLNIAVPYGRMVNSEWCIGNNITNSKNVTNSYDVDNCEQCKYTYQFFSSQDCYDSVIWWGNSTCMYENQCTGNKNHRVAFCTNGVTKSSDVFYSQACQSSSHLFWCIGLRNKQYCILNKQYTREEYETLVPRIIEHMMKALPRPSGTPSNEGECEWGEFFPSTLSPFGYNETVAQEYYPLTREGVLSLRGETEAIQDTSAIANLSWKEEIWPGSPRFARDDGTSHSFRHWPVFNWSDYEAPFPKVEKIIPADKLPDDISKIPDDILNWAIECEITKKPFRIIKQELEFYRKHNLPIPRRHPDQRHLDRMALRNPRKLFERKCDKCGVEMVTTYSPERPEKVYCEDCYNAEVIG